MAEYIDARKFSDRLSAQYDRLDPDKFEERYIRIGIHAARETIKDMPKEDLAPVKHGVWKWCSSIEKMVCSLCGEDDFSDEDLYNLAAFKSRYKFCPSCGAKMS